MIIHKTNKEGYYICNRAVGNKNLKKGSYRWYEVTCKNCLRQRPKEYYQPKLMFKEMNEKEIEEFKADFFKIDTNSIFTSDKPIEFTFDKKRYDNENKSLLYLLDVLEYNNASWYKKIYLYIKRELKKFINHFKNNRKETEL